MNIKRGIVIGFSIAMASTFVLLVIAPMFFSMRSIGDAGIWAGVGFGIPLIVGYQFSARWWETETGWHIMYFTGSLVAILAYVLYRTITARIRPPISSSDELARTIIYWVVSSGIIWRFFMLFRKQVLVEWHRSRAIRKNKEDSER